MWLQKKECNLAELCRGGVVHFQFPLKTRVFSLFFCPTKLKVGDIIKPLMLHLMSGQENAASALILLIDALFSPPDPCM